MEEQDRIETEETDVEGHKIADRLHEPEGEDKGRHQSDEDEPDVEGHKLGHKLDTKFDV